MAGRPRPGAERRLARLRAGLRPASAPPGPKLSPALRRCLSLLRRLLSGAPGLGTAWGEARLFGRLLLACAPRPQPGQHAVEQLARP